MLVCCLIIEADTDFDGVINNNQTVKKVSLLGDRLENKLNLLPWQDGYVKGNELMKVVILLNDVGMIPSAPASFLEVHVDAFGQETIFANGKKQDIDFVKKENANISAYLKQFNQRKKEKIQDSIASFAKKNNVLNSSAIHKAILEGRDTFEIELSKAHIRVFANLNKELISGIELPLDPKEQLGTAMSDTKVNPYALYSYRGRGNGIGIFISDRRCPKNGYISNYTSLASWTASSSDHSERISQIIRGVSPLSYLYCQPGTGLPTATILQGSGGNPQVLIESYSWGDTTNRLYSYRDKDFDNHVYDTNTVVFVAAGNQPEVGSPGKALNVITVGNYDDTYDKIYTGIDPSAYLDPTDTKNEKPEIVAPGTDIFVPTKVESDGGTSYASPHAAGFAADLMSDYSWMRERPHYFKAIMLAAATKPISGGEEKVGVGGLDYHRAFYNSTNTNFEGMSYEYWASHDIQPTSPYLERNYNLSSGKNVRVAISWLNRGNYVKAYKNLGKDFDLEVYAPNGTQVCNGGYKRYDPYEVCEFVTTTSGYHMVKIKRHANRDTAVNMRLGVSVNWK